MEDDFNFLQNGRRPEFIENGRWPQFFLMEDDLNFFINGRRPEVFQMEDDLIFFIRKTTPFFGKWKTTLFSSPMKIWEKNEM